MCSGHCGGVCRSFWRLTADAHCATSASSHEPPSWPSPSQLPHTSRLGSSTPLLTYLLYEHSIVIPSTPTSIYTLMFTRLKRALQRSDHQDGEESERTPLTPPTQQHTPSTHTPPAHISPQRPPPMSWHFTSGPVQLVPSSALQRISQTHANMRAAGAGHLLPPTPTLPTNVNDRVASMIGMGFSAQDSIKALEAHNYDVEAAALDLGNRASSLSSSSTLSTVQHTTSTSSTSSTTSSVLTQVLDKDTPLPNPPYERLPPLPPPSFTSSSTPFSLLDQRMNQQEGAPPVYEQPDTSNTMWACTMCTYENTSDRERCEMCNTPCPRPSNICGICFEPVTSTTLYTYSQPHHQRGEEEHREQEERNRGNNNTTNTTTCTHIFCRSCMRQYAHSRLTIHPPITCPSYKCPRIINDGEMKELVNDENEYRKYWRYKRNIELSCDPRVMWCLTPGCETALFGHSQSPQLSCPYCHITQCFTCHITPYHTGMTCRQYREEEREREEMKVARGIVANERLFHDAMSLAKSRQCLRCKAWINKTQGCDKMTCRCGYQFCYVCGSEGARCACTGCKLYTGKYTVDASTTTC